MSMSFWERLPEQKKRIILLWIFILKSERIDAIANSFIEAVRIDRDYMIDPLKIPDYIYMMNQKQIVSELNKVGGPPSWIN
jgi:hypothetical protein